MKNSILFLAFLLLSSVGLSAQKEYKATHEGWLVNIDDAYALSKKTGKPILANFTGSDWCGWCKRLSAAVFNKPDFKSWAEDNVVLLELDFPRRKQIPDEIRQQNQSLQRAFQVRGYPTVWVFNLDKDESKGGFVIEALGKTGYTATLEEFTSGVDQMISRGGKGK
ncbi:thioredoxin family protein [Flavilitoribacter nigricans]|uniref:Thioredoxin family protein n=1 Tax=Flavilitoribacter nigricans (strain ATCC 23147 / DSM 23189 / NBRC 102662 / NCIMB 1420 / SS-2) TaxID=1122177 RepID=A0A2D0NI81_FLAN2|nr:thioredoxin family protein [Flavilitoribacter nigricans]PHN08138.1 thioredoxin family protein [Flavilitoribacter nigricans DSM 23189 = NBRC 102662]